ncbi:MAG: glycosyltransferase family 9 protein [Planctomycetota bacterium]
MKQLRRGRYDIAIDAQGLARSAALAWLSGAPVRVGHRDAREFGWAALTHRVPPAESPHTVDRMLSLLGPLGVPVVRDMRLTTPANCNSGLPSDAEPIVLAPTSLWPGKQWPSDRFAELASRLHARGIGPFVVVGGPGEREQCLPLLDAPGIPIIDRVGKTSVGELMAIIEHARLVVANDSAALHIAVGYDKPIVALFGPTKTHLVGPYRRDSDVLQHADGPADSSHKDAAAGRAMMERITVDEVERAVLDRL